MAEPGDGLPAGGFEKISPRDFEKVCAIAREEFGLELKQGKEELVSARLSKLARRQGSASMGEFVRGMLADNTGEQLLDLIDALATNHTSFLREPAHFDFLRREVLDSYRQPGPFRVWSAACSTGEEPCTLAFILSDWAAKTGSRFRILATDISRRALEGAQRAVYPKDRCASVDPQWLKRYFLQGTGRWAGHYRVRPEILSAIEFRRLNLIEPLPAMRFEAIFCRNVMIYFSRETQSRLVEKLAACLEPGGHLFVGHAESLNGIRHSLEFVCPAVYRAPGRVRAKEVVR